jgi:tetratricopeptide (TPR) repeat protein
MDFRQKYLKAINEFEKVDFYKRQSTQIKHLNIAKNLVEECLSENPQDYKCWYLLGLIWYWFPRETQDRNENCERALKKAIKIKPVDDWSNMYLGHLYFDHNKYKKALEQFQKVEKSNFNATHLNWRIIKLDELIICCKLQLDLDNFAILEFESYKNFCESMFKKDEFEYIFPLELIRCFVALSKNKKTNKTKLKILFTQFKNMLEKTDNIEFFKNDVDIIENNL